MNTDPERLARATISLVAEPGDLRCLGLTRELGGVQFLQALQEHPDLGPVLAAVAARLADVRPERELERAERLGVRFVIPGDAEWPVQLDDLAHLAPLNERGEVPVGLWVKGPLRLDQLDRSVAVVGARASTTYGDQVASDMAAVVGGAGRPVVSGAAFGIDYAAHRGALSAGAPTVAVLACGPDRAYPAAHRELLAHLAQHHAVVSESPPGASPFRIRFLARNRLIAALSRGTVVVEAAVRSGALNTTNWAERLNRVVMGTPGPLTSVASEGVHQLIRSGAATLVSGGEEVLELLGAAGEDLVVEPRGPERERDRLAIRAQQVLDAVPVVTPAPAESIALVAGLGVTSVREMLDDLANEGYVEQLPVGWRLAERAHC
ncbi:MULTISPECIES: DNA-processing protein DprA [unclassified Nocardioides]|uniref:DNA-processing protein DprA n=1 Tax=unclassified Nocardioides TaxID=2615069 RepID=UPI0006F3F60D|nr:MULTISPECIES: DNA-processing protein DprA [unclassified Nocardioides]KRA29559.1 DNA protecting protein DprA [Nocardioides sp. Root614]KRA88266.1 DNA protecting protein DprA [Nocardioides sp. Root682]